MNNELQYQADFRRMVVINEEIKRIVRVSNVVNMAALNAMFIARKAGQAALGFGVVSAELRVFSQRLNEVMSAMSGQIFALLSEVSGQARQWKTHRAHLAAARGSERSGHYLAELLGTLEQAMALKKRDIHARQEQLIAGLGRARKLCGMGVTISRAAKIEAAYGNALASGLKQVAEEVEQSITDILATLKALEQQLAASANYGM
ncbi:MAG: hypothetical protein P4L77_02190 [Sulfuriferula sp.]|nr:hypothetical protein [Sulfuriferula sp.]